LFGDEVDVGETKAKRDGLEVILYGFFLAFTKILQKSREIQHTMDEIGECTISAPALPRSLEAGSRDGFHTLLADVHGLDCQVTWAESI
jgi:hypothetical protein